MVKTGHAHSHKMASMLKVFQNSLLYSPRFLKAALISLLVLAASSYSELNGASESLSPSKENPLNQYYVKYNWGWTLLFLVPTVALTALLYTGMELRVALRHLLRLILNHLIWFVGTNSFLWYQRYVGACSNTAFTNRSTCLAQGHTWDDVDISGHVFLLSFSTMVISEEVISISPRAWNNYRLSPLNPPLPQRKISLLSGLHKNQLTNLIVYLLEVVAGVEIILNIAMMLITCLYFHTFLEKILALVISLSSWYISYYVLCGARKWLPCTICEGRLNPLRMTT